MLAEIFLMQLETSLRESRLNGPSANARFVPIAHGDLRAKRSFKTK
jgi:hypothetical protein